jgi:large subunit ribosomal protein L18
MKWLKRKSVRLPLQAKAGNKELVMDSKNQRKDKAFKRKARVTFKVKQNLNKNILYVFRSNKFIYAQIADSSGMTILGISSKNVEMPADAKGKIDASFKTGKVLAQKAQEKNITEVVFNRGSYKYHGRIKALAQGARDGGLKF